MCWEFIRKKRDEGKIVLLTTHYMDEAEILADRVAVMSEGVVRAYGTTQFLKNMFKCGYKIKVFWFFG